MEQMLKPCPFCEAYQSQKNVSQFTKEHPEHYGNLVHLFELRCALVKRSWIKGRPKNTASRSTDYYFRGIGYPLHYCPTCGKRLDDE